MKKWLLFISFAVIALLATVYFASPRYAISKLELAARNGNVEQLQHYIDFPSLRGNLNNRLQHRLNEALGEDTPDEVREFLAAGSSLLVGPLLQQLVAPENIGDLLSGGKALVQFGHEMYRQPLPSTEKKHRGWRLLHWRFASINRVTADYGDEQSAQLRLILERHGLHWQLVDLELLKE